MLLILRRLLAWGHNGALILGFYLMAAVYWRVGLSHKPGTIYFVVAGILLAIGFSGSVGWLWTRDIFWRSSLRRSQRESPEFYEWPKNSFWVWVGMFAVLCLTLEWRLVHSYKARPSKEVRAAVSIFIADPNAEPNADPERTKARAVPALHGAGDKAMVFALASLPRKEVDVHYDDKSVILQVVIQNTGSIDIRDAHITIDSDATIHPGPKGLVSVSDTELSGMLPVLNRYVAGQLETTFQVELLIPEFRQTPGLLVTVEGANMRPISGAVKLMLQKTLTTPAGAGAVHPATKPQGGAKR